jgi:hypothetical protein
MVRNGTEEKLRKFADQAVAMPKYVVSTLRRPMLLL